MLCLITQDTHLCTLSCNFLFSIPSRGEPSITCREIDMMTTLTEKGGQIISWILWFILRLLGVWIDRIEVQFGPNGCILLSSVQVPKWALCRAIKSAIYINSASIKMIKLRIPWPWAITTKPMQIEVKGVALYMCRDMDRAAVYATQPSSGNAGGIPDTKARTLKRGNITMTRTFS